MWGFSIQDPFSTLLPFPKENDDATSKQSTQKLSMLHSAHLEILSPLGPDEGVKRPHLEPFFIGTVNQSETRERKAG